MVASGEDSGEYGFLFSEPCFAGGGVSAGRRSTGGLFSCPFDALGLAPWGAALVGGAGPRNQGSAPTAR